MIPQVTVAQLKERLDAGQATYLVDVRQPWEHEVAAIPGSVLVPLPELPGHLDEIDPPPGALVVVYCHHGVRSLSGAALLAHHGAVSLAGGIEAWSLHIDPSVPRY
jgi:rhodanese-related sulfurtransferase